MALSDLTILDIHPSQFYLSEEKIRNIRNWFDPRDLSRFDPVPVKELNGRVIFTDGHTRAWVAHRAGLEKIPLVWDEDELDWEAYQMYVEACKRRGVHTVADLSDRILSGEMYAAKWHAWCDGLQHALDMKRGLR